MAAVAWHYKNSAAKRTGSWLLLIVGAGMMADPIFSTTCHIEGGRCIEYLSVPFILHAIETVVTSVAIFVLAVYDAYLRRRLLSIAFVVFQILYGLLFVSQLASQDRFNTVSQFVYEFGLIVWLAWYVRDYLVGSTTGVAVSRDSLVKDVIAIWAFLNGIFAILVSLADIHIVGRLKGLYFAGDSAWLAQHGVIIGVILIYISRHLWRGERRARHLFMLAAAIEVIKYAVITPHPSLLALYFSSFVGLFILKRPFDRGRRELTWRLRIGELVFLVSSFILAAVIALFVLYSGRHSTEIANKSLDHFFDYTLRHPIRPRTHRESVLLAHTISAFILSSTALVLWVLFRPARPIISQPKSHQVRLLLDKYSRSSEDYFKLWPHDKQYFIGKDSFIAYKVAGPVAYVLADPIAKDRSRSLALLRKFLDFCKENGWRVAILPVYEDSLELYEEAGLNKIQIGASALIDIERFTSRTIKDKWWRWKNNRAVKAGLSYHLSTPPHAANLLEEFNKVSDVWLTKEGRQERAFALGYFDKDYIDRCNVHYLTDETSHVVSFANQLPQFNSGPTGTLDLLRHLPSQPDAMPYLLHQTIQDFQAQGLKYFDLGFVPFASSDEPIVKLVKALSGGRFSAGGLEQFKNKFEPAWQPNYLVYDGDIADLALITLNLEAAMTVL